MLLKTGLQIIMTLFLEMDIQLCVVKTHTLIRNETNISKGTKDTFNYCY